MLYIVYNFSSSSFLVAVGCCCLICAFVRYALSSLNWEFTIGIFKYKHAYRRIHHTTSMRKSNNNLNFLLYSFDFSFWVHSFLLYISRLSLTITDYDWFFSSVHPKNNSTKLSSIYFVTIIQFKCGQILKLRVLLNIRDLCKFRCAIKFHLIYLH